MLTLALILLMGTPSGPPAPETPEFAEGRVPAVGLQGPHLDACGGIGRIGGADEEHPVLEGPGEDTRTNEKLARGTLVWLCEAAGEWQGVVYASGQFQDITDCRVSTPVPEPQPYDGPCRAGWVKAKTIELLAG